MNIWFTSDTHYNHDKIVELSNRPATDVVDMNETMIAKWNDVVKDGDLVYHLGDVAYPPKADNHITYDELGSRLNGIKKLIRGNHDRERMKASNADQIKIFEHWMWDEVLDYEELKYGKTRFVLCHYPIDSWRSAHREWLHLHGHLHCNNVAPGGKFYKPHRLDVGVDRQNRTGDYSEFGQLWSIDEIRDMLKAQEDYDPVSHHGE